MKYLLNLSSLVSLVLVGCKKKSTDHNLRNDGAGFDQGFAMGIPKVNYSLFVSNGPGQAFTANLVTGIMVLFASKIGLPVSTTHVSCGSIFGIGVATKQAHWDVIKKILLAWSVTLPIGFGLGALGFTLCMFL